jgi:hypothetical protein
MTNIKHNIAAIEQQISLACKQNNRLAQEISLLAVSKTKPTEMIKQAYAVGQRQFGENYVQEGITKIVELAELNDIIWHFIGPIQSNKTKAIAEHFDWVQSVDREKIAARLNDQRAILNKPLNVCIQINIDNEASKSGISVSELPKLAKFISTCEHLTLRGIMAVPSKTAEAKSYQHLQQLFIELQQHYPHIDTLSVGMSNDLTQAIANGSTMVRIGSAIFGERK